MRLPPCVGAATTVAVAPGTPACSPDAANQATHQPSLVLYPQFHVRYKTDFGQTVCLVGNVDALGKWQVDHAVQLAWSEGHLWQGSIPIPEG